MSEQSSPPIDPGEEVILRFNPLPKTHPHDDVADEYAIVRCDWAMSGIIIFGFAFLGQVLFGMIRSGS